MVRRLLGERSDPAAAGGGTPVTEQQLARARWIGRTVRAAAARTPWRSDCYPQALTARLLLRAAGVPHGVTFGLRRDDTAGLRAHVWVRVGDLVVAGGSAHGWAGVATFSWAPR